MNPTVNPFHPSADPRDALTHCESAVRADRWFEKAGVSEHWPLTTDEAAKLLADAGGYDIDAERLADLVRRRLLVGPAEDEAGREWSV